MFCGRQKCGQLSGGTQDCYPELVKLTFFPQQKTFTAVKRDKSISSKSISKTSDIIVKHCQEK